MPSSVLPLETWSHQNWCLHWNTCQISYNRFLLNFTIALWTERRMRATHFLALSWGWLPFTVVVFKDYPRLHTFFSTLFGLETLTMLPFTQLVSTNKDMEMFISRLSMCYLSVLSEFLLCHTHSGYSPPCPHCQWFITWGINRLWCENPGTQN